MDISSQAGIAAVLHPDRVWIEGQMLCLHVTLISKGICSESFALPFLCARVSHSEDGNEGVHLLKGSDSLSSIWTFA